MGGHRLVVERSPVAAERLERLRTKLLDLSTNNRTLSFRHPRAACLRVVDELPEVIFQKLLQGEELTFEPVEEPSHRELQAWHARSDLVPRAGETIDLKRPDAATWARHLGLNTDYDLPIETDSFLRTARHNDKKIQALHYPDELDARLRKIRAAGRTAIEESGANMLYMAFGFLEWRDQTTSKAHQAPLLLLPVELERDQPRAGQYRTKVRWTNEELQPNLSLRKKLEEFNIHLPELQEDQKLEAYFSEVTRAVRHKPGWIARRYITLGLFEFGKILLYLDLDPERWPTHAPIDGHPLVRKVLEGEDGNEAGGVRYPGKEDLSHEVELCDLQLDLVDRADSSQCEALQIALKGQSLVIEGPPGTGKSQTITNLVAAALAAGKTVLFVAEKLAALEVVRRRMRELGLGDFCLELHSHKTRKTEVLEDIADRMKMPARSRTPKELEAAMARLAAHRKKLSDYIDIISRPAAAFGDFTVGGVLMRAGQARRRLGAKIKALEPIRPKTEDAVQINWASLSDAKARLRQFAAAFKALDVRGSAYEHPWAGVSAAQVLPHDSAHIASLADDWANAAEELERTLQQTNSLELTAAELIGAQAKLAALDELRIPVHQAEELVSQIEQALGISIPRTSHGATDALGILYAATIAPQESLGIRNDFILTPGAVEWLRQHEERVGSVRKQREGLREIFRDDAFTIAVDDLEEWSATLHQRGFFVRIQRRWRSAIAAWQACARPGHLKTKSKEKAAYLASLRQVLLDHSALQSDRTVEERLGEAGRDLTSDFQGAIAVAEWTDKVSSTLPDGLFKLLVRCKSFSIERLRQLANDTNVAALEKISRANLANGKTTFWRALVSNFIPGLLGQRAANISNIEEWQKFLADIEICSHAAERVHRSEKSFFSATNLDERIWFGDKRPSLAGLASRTRLAAANAALLPQWLDFDRFRRASEEAIESGLIHAVATGRMDTEQLEICLDFLVFDSLARQAFADSPLLHSVSGRSLDALREEYRSLDAQVMELRRAAIAARLLQRRPPEGRQSGLKSELTEMALIRAEIAKQRRTSLSGNSLRVPDGHFRL